MSQMSSLETTDFSKLGQALHTTTFLAYQGKGQFCQIFMMSDHNSKECALNSYQRDRQLKSNRKDNLWSPKEERREYATVGMKRSASDIHTAQLSIGVSSVEETIRK